jgi:oligopeptidase B
MKQNALNAALFCIISMLLLQNCKNTPSSTSTNTNNLEQKSAFSPEKFRSPQAAIIQKELVSAFGEKRNDPYYWLNERENPKVLDYLKAENLLFDSVMAPVVGLQQKLFDEMVARVKQDDNSVPYFKNSYWYYTRYETGKEYPIYCRKKGAMEASEEIMLNVNELAKDKKYCNIVGLNVSPDNRLMYYAADFTGRNLYNVTILDLTTGKNLPDTFESAFGGSAWANDSKHIFYDTKDAVTLRTDKIWRHKIGTPTKMDALMFHETDETAYCAIGKSKSEQYLFITHGYTLNMETHFLSANTPDGKFQVLKPREKDVFYNVEHFGDKFLIWTNKDKSPNFKIMETPVNAIAVSNWKDVLPHREDVLIESFEVFKDYLVTAERKGGLKQLHIIQWSGKSDHYLDFGEPTYDANVDYNPEFDTKTLRYNFSSLKTPPTVVDYSMDTRQKSVKKVEPVLGGFNSDNYETQFVWATAHDGEKIPVSLVYKKGLKKDGSAPCYMTGYGSYGFSSDPRFNKPVISLLDRGFVYAIAHIRGGMEMGYKWYEKGKLQHKINTFTDFIDCAELLCKDKYTNPQRLFASGRSAGGLLMGAVATMRPDLFKGIIAGVPFVDVLTTMSDASIPLTTGEYTEWGNPNNKADYDYMAKYSPYDNVKAQNYPNLMVLTSLSDSQVQYFEPAKWVAKLRATKKGDNMLIFNTDMTGSHGGSSGRFERLKERAREFSWMMGLLGMTDEKLKN